jgi:hypothetical protein
MTEYLNIRASETLGQGTLVKFLKFRFPQSTKAIGRAIVQGTESVETRVVSGSAKFEEIRRFVDRERKRRVPGFTDFTIGQYLRKYTKSELHNAEVLRVTIPTYFEPSGEECGTIYQTLCDKCNLGRQLSGLILDVRRIPRYKDISQTVAWVEWVVSSKFASIFKGKN